MEQTLGQMIGKVKSRAFSTKSTKDERSTEITVWFDYGQMTDEELIKVLNDNRIIALQNSGGLRKLPCDKILGYDGKAFDAKSPSVDKVIDLDKIVASMDASDIDAMIAKLEAMKATKTN